MKDSELTRHLNLIIQLEGLQMKVCMALVLLEWLLIVTWGRYGLGLFTRAGHYSNISRAGNWDIFNAQNHHPTTVHSR